MPRLINSLSRSARCASINQSFAPKFTAKFHTIKQSTNLLPKQCLVVSRQLQTIVQNKSFSTLSINQQSNQSNDQSNHEQSTKRTIFLAAPVAAALAAFLIDQSEKNQMMCEAIPASLAPINQSMQKSISKVEQQLVNSLKYDTEIAPWWRRALAWVIDNSIVSLLYQITSMLYPASQYDVYAVTAISLICNAGYEILSLMYNDSATLGKWVFGLRVQRENYEPMDLQTASWYWTGKLLNFVFGADVLFGLLDFAGDKKCIHNWLSDTIVLHQMKIDDDRARRTINMA